MSGLGFPTLEEYTCPFIQAISRILPFQESNQGGYGNSDKRYLRTDGVYYYKENVPFNYTSVADMKYSRTLIPVGCIPTARGGFVLQLPISNP